MRDALNFTYGAVLGVSASFALHSEWFGHHRHALFQVGLGCVIVLVVHFFSAKESA